MIDESARAAPYVVVSEPTLELVEARVTELVRAGYCCAGGVSMDHAAPYHYNQAMAWPKVIGDSVR